MQSKLFVFIGLPGKTSDINLEVIKDRLESNFSKNNLLLTFNLKEELLSARLEDVTYYISFLNNKGELMDWYEMARNFELTVDKDPVSKKDLLKRYELLQKSNSSPYKKSHFATAELIMDELEKLEDVIFYSFQ